MTLYKQLLTLLLSKFSEECQERRAQSLYISSRKLIQIKIRLTYALNVIEIISTWDVLFQAQTKQPEYVKSFELDYGVCSRHQHTYGMVIVDCMESVLESPRDSAKNLILAIKYICPSYRKADVDFENRIGSNPAIVVILHRWFVV